jgi:hypothetical protein
MSKRPFLCGQRSVVEQPLAPKTRVSRIGIQISWNEGVVTPVKIQHQPVAMGEKVYGTHLQARFGRGHDAQFALNAELQMIFASRQGRVA